MVGSRELQSAYRPIRSRLEIARAPGRLLSKSLFTLRFGKTNCRSLVLELQLVRLVGLALALLGGGLSNAAPPGASERPNIVVFISDDLGRLDTSIHGSVDALTPTMELLASQGMVFENAFVASPSCCPNRFSLLTGLMPARHGAHPNHSQVKPGTRFLIPKLKELGYHICSFGKVAHGRKGFDGLDFNSPSPRNMHANVEKYFAEREIEEPIWLLVGDRRPHVAWTKQSTYDPKALTLPPYFVDTLETRQHWGRYLTDVTGMDLEMGRIHDFARRKLGKNTVFLFTSDHGGQWPRGKWNLYDSGIRVPLVVTWPGHIAAKVRTQAQVSWVDIIPTLIELAGGEVSQGIDGKSFAPVLLGASDQHRGAIFTTHTGDGEMNVFPMRSIRKDGYKLVHNLCPNAYHTNHSDRLRKDGAGAYWHSWDKAARTDKTAARIIKSYYTRDEFELFNLEADPNELRNLAKDPSYASVLSRLRAELREWTTGQGDDLRPHREPYPKSNELPQMSK